MDSNNILHLKNGNFVSDSALETLKRWVATAIDEPNNASWVFHFHGGLVSESAGRNIASRLTPIYEQAGATPLFFVWESGLLETIKNNGHEIVQENFFKETVKKITKWAVRKLPGELGFKGQGQSLKTEKKIELQLDAWLKGQSLVRNDLLDIETVETQPVKSKSALPVVDVDRLRVELEADIQTDANFKRAYQMVYNGLYDINSHPVTAKGSGTQVSANSAISPEAAESLFNSSPFTTKGLLSWAKVAKVIAGIVIRVVKRFIKGRDHGLYLSVVEEVLRALYADKLGGLIWTAMKKDTADAFVNNEQAGGYRLLTEIKQKLVDGACVPTITLIGHSTGAIYIRYFLKAAARLLPDVKFNLIYLAAAESYQGFASLISQHKNQIMHFRAFAMSDYWERKDGIVPVLYPASLLYFVSGLLEDEVDKPLIGMQRFLNGTEFKDGQEFQDIARSRAFFQEADHTLIFAPMSDKNGCRSQSNSHGGFDEDEETLKSIQYILGNGYI